MKRKNMDYKVFKDTILAELADFYGKDADAITVRNMKDTDGKEYEGIDISIQGVGNRDSQIINLSALYDRYAAGEIDLYDCVEVIYRKREGQKIPIKASDKS